MFDKFDVWKYQDSANCWDFVRSWLIEKADVPVADVPKYGICPNNKREMTEAAIVVARSFKEVDEPINNAVACHYRGKVLYHVGVVDGEYVRHVSTQRGCVKEKIQSFMKTEDTRFYAYS